MNDKKELSINCEKLMKENCLLNESKRNYSENDMDILKSYETKTNEEKDKFLKEIESLNKKVTKI